MSLKVFGALTRADFAPGKGGGDLIRVDLTRGSSVVVVYWDICQHSESNPAARWIDISPWLPQVSNGELSNPQVIIVPDNKTSKI